MNSAHDVYGSDRETAGDLGSEDESCEIKMTDSLSESEEDEEGSEVDENESPGASLPEEVTVDPTETIDNGSNHPTPSIRAHNEHKIIIHDIVQTTVDDEFEREKKDFEYEQYLKELENRRQEDSKIDEMKRAQSLHQHTSSAPKPLKPAQNAEASSSKQQNTALALDSTGFSGDEFDPEVQRALLEQCGQYIQSEAPVDVKGKGVPGRPPKYPSKSTVAAPPEFDPEIQRALWEKCSQNVQSEVIVDVKGKGVPGRPPKYPLMSTIAPVFESVAVQPQQKTSFEPAPEEVPVPQPRQPLGAIEMPTVVVVPESPEEVEEDFENQPTEAPAPQPRQPLGAIEVPAVVVIPETPEDTGVESENHPVEIQQAATVVQSSPKIPVIRREERLPKHLNVVKSRKRRDPIGRLDGKQHALCRVRAYTDCFAYH